MKVHDDQSVIKISGSPPLPVTYPPRVLVSALPESWPVSSRGVMSMKVHHEQSVIDKTGSSPLKYSPTVLVSTLLESWPIGSGR